MLVQLSILVLAMVASGCATILNGSSQAVTFDSSPNGASIFVDGVEVGKTPLSMLMRRSRTTMILAKKDGYEDQHLALQTTTSGNFWMNWGFAGSTVDYFSDAMIEYSPNQYYIRLNRIPILQSQAGVVGVDSGTYKRLEQEGSSIEARVKAYILRSDQNLRADISRGRGEYLSSLSVLLRLPESGQTLKRLRAIAARNREAPSFADAILSEYPAK